MSWRRGKRIVGKVAVPLAAALTLGAVTYGLQPATFLGTTAAQADDGSQTSGLWQVQSVEGGAEARRDGGDNWFPVRIGQALEPGSEIRTERESRVALISGREVLDVAPDSRVELPPVMKVPPMRVIQWFGDVMYEVGKRPSRGFEVDTPHLAVVVKGTKFMVQVDDDGSVVDVSEGIVTVAAEGNRDHLVDVAAGVAASVLAGAPGTVSIGPGSGSVGRSTAAGSNGNGPDGGDRPGGMQGGTGSGGSSSGGSGTGEGEGDGDGDSDSGDNDNGDNDGDSNSGSSGGSNE